ncbi:MAG: AmmeMemoRadiSam system radical SAM enzyme [Candidatus Dadabacteria bacterium]|nr:AmmeMemoRadiSam system radical SAM enzyme [Candidatus Dadabacteria bacterium]NIS08993.1 AmmeMemoRadiSam system radical SAM enzyme [Candidatus Dadabacteria bacterium]NIV41036.1 AmmeMemoRadiSam system radical SAM enzyme [Candidatus Dadabacteria bacterium]NIX15595.1 AmmeMemoRadiSam system radical SAM enzyme [Candidatus Dadabacteria bacterium]NIY22336.1 AmmeMemoRadiSam system radical SAM enzyme [Candidatus Dadabacteria bacterium]
MIERSFMDTYTIKGNWWHKMDDGRIQCDLCPRNCRLNDGQQGFCYIREARNGELVLTSYGRASGFCIDPIEKKPLNHFYPGSSVLSFGTAGCNLGCRFCQNWDISKAREDDRLTSPASPEKIARAAKEHGCKSIAFTYNDPVIFAEYAIDSSLAAHELDIKTVAVTAGYITAEARGDFYRNIDAANIDLKAFTQEFYGKICFAELEPVLDTLIWLKNETDVWIEVTTLLIPDHNDSDDEITKLSQWFLDNLGPETPLHFTAFHPDFKMMDVPATPPQTLSRARNIAKKIGMYHVYTGNVYDTEGQSTYCHNCSNIIIERNWYELGKWNLDNNGCCNKCGEKLSGHFEKTPGDWGSKRLPVLIS